MGEPATLARPAAPRDRPVATLPNYLPGAVVAIVLFFPTGIAALASIFKARRLLAAGERREARATNDRARELIWYSVGIGTTILAVVFVVLLLTLNGGAARHAFVDFSKFHFAEVLRGFGTNISLFMVTEVIVLVWALALAVLRGLPGPAAAPVRFLGVVYTDVFRGLPAIVVIYMVAFGFKRAGLPLVKDFTDYQAGVLALTLVYGAYVAEVYRAGIESIHWSQVAAARSLGLSWSRTMRYVIVPQAVRRIIPPLLNDFIGLQKDTALVSTIGIFESFNTAKSTASFNGNLSPITGVAICFVVITIPLARFVDYLVRRDQAKMRAGS
jgi:polar amino acid transport system permease protein